jgi:hypothetical protein
MNDETLELLIAELKDLRIRVARLEADKVNERTTPSTNDGEEGTFDLKKDDRVQITNRVRKPATWPNSVTWDKEKERNATVTKVTTDQIHIITDNGTRTWRAPNNLKRV